jgi:hypothetical protein
MKFWPDARCANARTGEATCGGRSCRARSNTLKPIGRRSDRRRPRRDLHPGVSHREFELRARRIPVDRLEIEVAPLNRRIRYPPTPSTASATTKAIRNFTETDRSSKNSIEALPFPRDATVSTSRWQGLCAPKNTPADIIDKLNKEIKSCAQPTTLIQGSQAKMPLSLRCLLQLLRRLLEVAQIRRRLVLSCRHQETVRTQIKILIGDHDVDVIFGTNVLAPPDRSLGGDAMVVERGPRTLNASSTTVISSYSVFGSFLSR